VCVCVWGGAERYSKPKRVYVAHAHDPPECVRPAEHVRVELPWL